jgi:hypothetical protein
VAGSGAGSTGCSELDGGSAEDEAGGGLGSGLGSPGTVITGPEVVALLEVDALTGVLLGAA